MSLSVFFGGVGPDTIIIQDNGDPTDGVFVIHSVNGQFGDLAYAIPADSLSLYFGPDQQVIWNLDEDLGAMNLTIGSLTNSADNPTQVTIDQINTTGAVVIAANGAINELGSDAGVDITAASVALSAGSGVGNLGAIETQVSSIEAETNTGGINIANIGALTVGSVSADIAGLQVATSGSVTLTNIGTISLNDTDGFTAIVSAGANSGHVTLTANGGFAGIGAAVNRDAITAAAGNITLNATGNVSFGTSADADNDVRANGNITVNAGGYFYIDGFSDMSSDDFGNATGGDVTITANGVYVLDTYGLDASVGASGSGGGHVTLTAREGYEVSIQAVSTAAVWSNSGIVTINGDEITIAADSGITANAGPVILRPTTAGLGVSLGDGSTAALDLSDAEIDRVFANEVIIGSGSAGVLSVVNNISNTNPNLTLLSGDNILVKPGVTLATTGGLTLKAGRDIVLSAGSTVNVTGVLNGFVDTPSDDSEGGVLKLLGTLTAAGMTFQGFGDADTLVGSANGETLAGNSGNDLLKGLAGNDILQGGSGNDTLEGGADNDTLDGGNGNDTATYVSAGAGVTVNLASGAAQNTVSAGLDTLTAIENLTGSEFNDTLSGTATANTIRGLGGNDLIKPGAGNDTVYGGLGDDDVYVDSAGDVVIELVGEGSDRILSTVSYSLPVNVETLTLVGGDPINATGNSAGNSLIGNDANNTLMGMGSADVLRGNGGDDILDGGTGPDNMIGGAGNDTYIVDQSGDTINETVGNGLDQVNSSATFALALNVENLTLTGANNVNATGNVSSNVIIGNSGTNNITGGGDNDTLTGGGGADTFIYTTVTDSTLADLDVVTDYQDGVDRLNVQTIDANTDLGGNQMFSRVVGDGAFTAAAQLRLTFDGTYTHVEFNTDADTDAEFAILLTGNHTGDTVEDNWIL